MAAEKFQRVLLIRSEKKLTGISLNYTKNLILSKMVLESPFLNST